MKRSLNSASLDASSDGADSASFRLSPSELGGETQGPRLGPVAWSARLQQLPDGPAQVSDNHSGRRRSSSGRSRRRRHRRADPWEAYVRDNWIPTLEHTFGPDWRRHCPGEVAALIWWAIASRAGFTPVTATVETKHFESSPRQPATSPEAAATTTPLTLYSTFSAASSRVPGSPGMARPLHALLLPVSAESLLASGGLPSGRVGASGGDAETDLGNVPPLASSAVAVPSSSQQQQQQQGRHGTKANPLCGAAPSQCGVSLALAHNGGGIRGGTGDHSGDHSAAYAPLTAFAAVVTAPVVQDRKWSQPHTVVGSVPAVAAHSNVQQGVIAGGGNKYGNSITRRRQAAASSDGGVEADSSEVLRVSSFATSAEAGQEGSKPNALPASGTVPEAVSAGGFLVGGHTGWDAAEEADLLFMLQQGLEARLADKQQQQYHQQYSHETVAVSSSIISLGGAGGSNTSASGRTLPVLDLSRPYLNRTDGGELGGSEKGMAVGDGIASVRADLPTHVTSPQATKGLAMHPAAQVVALSAGMPENLSAGGGGSTVHGSSTCGPKSIGNRETVCISDGDHGCSGTSRDSRAFVLDLGPSTFPISLSGDGSLRTLLDAVSNAIAAAASGGGDRAAGAVAVAAEVPALAAALLPPGSPWPARVLLPPDSTLPVAAASAVSKTYSMQLPDGTVVPVQLVPLHISLSGAGPNEAAGASGNGEAAAAVGLAADELSSLLATSASAVGGCRPLSELLNRSDPQGRLPLHAAAATGRVEMVERLLALGCDADRRLEKDFIHGGDIANTQLDCEYDCASSASSSYTDVAEENDSAVLDDANITEAVMLAARRRQMTGVEAEGAGISSAPMAAAVGADGFNASSGDAVGGGGEGDVDDTASGRSFTDSDDMAFGADDGSPSSMSVAQAARLGLHIALDTCGDRLTPDQLHFLAGKFAEQQLWKSTAAALMPAVAQGYIARANPAQTVTSSSTGACLRPPAACSADVATSMVQLPTDSGLSEEESGSEVSRGLGTAGPKAVCLEPVHLDLARGSCSEVGIDVTRQRHPVWQEGTVTLLRRPFPVLNAAPETSGLSLRPGDSSPSLWLPPSPTTEPNPDAQPRGIIVTQAAPAVVCVYKKVESRGTGSDGRGQQEQHSYEDVPGVAGTQSVETPENVVMPQSYEDAALSAMTVASLQHRNLLSRRIATEEHRKRQGKLPERLLGDEHKAGGDDDDEEHVEGVDGGCSCKAVDGSVAVGTACAIASDVVASDGPCGYCDDAGIASPVVVAAGAATVASGPAMAAEATSTMHAVANAILRRRPRRLTASASHNTVPQQQQPMYQQQHPVYDDSRVRGLVGGSGRNKRQADGDATDVGIADAEGDAAPGAFGGNAATVSLGGGSVGGGSADGGDPCKRDGVAACRAPSVTAAPPIAVGGGMWLPPLRATPSTDRRPAVVALGAMSSLPSDAKAEEYADNDGGVEADDYNEVGGEYDSNPDADVGTDADDADLQGLGVALLDGLGALPLPLGLSSRRFRRGRVPASFAARPSYVGASPLHLAAAHGHMKVCEVLMRAPGCDLAARTAQGRTALHLAARNGHEAVVALLLRSAAAVAATAVASTAGPAAGPPVSAGGVAAQSHLLAEVVDATDKEGHTALHHAAALGHWRVVEELWPRGASIDAADVCGRTPLHYAAMAGHVETAGRLIIAGAGVHRPDCDGYTPAHHAAMRGHAEVLEKLLLAGYEVDLLGGPTSPQTTVHGLPSSSGSNPGPMRAAEALTMSLSGPRSHLTPPASLPDEQQPQQKQQVGGPATTRDVPARPALRPLQQQQQPTSMPDAPQGVGSQQQQLAPATGSRSTTAGGGANGGHTALHMAASGGHCAAIAVLLQHGGTAERRDWRGCTALHRAAEGGYRGAFELLLMHGADPRVTDSSGASILHSAARGGNLAVVQRLLELESEMDPDTSGGGGRHRAASLSLSRVSPPRNFGTNGPTLEGKKRHGLDGQSQKQSGGPDATSTAMVPQPPQRAALELGAPPNGGSCYNGWRINPAEPAADGRLPLHWAAAAGRGQVVARLLQLGALAGGDPLQQDHAGATPWHLAAAAGQEASIRVFLAPPHGVTAVPVDARDGAGCTALHRAASAGAGGVVAVLLGAGADPAASDDGGRTPLHYAAEAGLVGVMRLLLEHVAAEDVDRRDASGWSALHHAAEQGNGAMLQLLLQQGACPLSVTAHGWTPAHLAARGHHTGLLADLLVAGADPRVRDADGCTPLHFAALRGDGELFEQLLAAASAAAAAAAASGAVSDTCTTFLDAMTTTTATTALPPSLLLRDARGYTLLHYAVEGGNMIIIERLLAAGLSEAAEAEAHPNGRAGSGETAKAEKGTGTATMPFGFGVTLPSNVLQARCPPPLSAFGLPQLAEQQDAQQPQVKCVAEAIPGPELLPSDDDMVLLPAGGQLQIRRPSDISAPSRAPLNALHLAAKLCMTNVVHVLLASGYSAISRTIAMDQSPLHFAAMGPVRNPIEARAGIEASASATQPEVVGVDATGSSSAQALPETLPRPQVTVPPTYQQRHSGGGSAASSAYHAEQIRVVDALMAAETDPLATDAWGCTALSYAAGSGNHVLVTRLLALGCDPLKADRRGLTPLHWGAAGGSAEVVAALLTASGSGSVSTTCAERLASLDCLGRTPLHWAAEAGSLGCVAVLTGAMLAAVLGISTGNVAAVGAATSGAAATAAAELLHAPDAGGCSAAQLAAAGGHVDVVAKLLEAGAGCSVATADGAPSAAGMSALHLAAQAGLEQVVTQLLYLAPRGGVDVNARDAEGFTPLHAATTRGSAAIAAQLLRAGADPNIASSEGLLPLHAAAAGGHLDVVELLLDAGSLVSYKSSGGATPLHQAASNGHAVICEVLLEAGCPVMGRLASGASALYCAASAGWEDVVEVLLRSGAEVDAATSSGCTALHGAATNGHAKVISLLLAEGADSDLQSSNGHTPLHNAAGSGHMAAVEALLAGGADVDAQNSNGNTPLHTASSKGYLDVISQLLSGGADLHIRNSKGWCAVHSAASNGFFEVVLKLVQAGASWRRQGEADVVRLLTRKTTYKTSYVEGRLRLAERERHRNNQQQQAGGARNVMGAGAMLLTAGSGALVATGAVGATASAGSGEAASGVGAGATGPVGRQKGAVPTTASFEDLAAAADANMAALLEEEAAAVAAAAERKAKQKKKKANKAASKSAAAATTASGTGTAETSTDDVAVTAGTNSASETRAKHDGTASAGANTKSDAGVMVGAQQSTGSVAAVSSSDSGDIAAVARFGRPSAPPKMCAISGAAEEKAGAPDGGGSGDIAAHTPAVGRTAAATAALRTASPKKPAAGQRPGKAGTAINTAVLATGNGSGKGTSTSSSGVSTPASPLKGGTGTMLRISMEGPQTANGIASGSGPGSGSKAKGQGANAGGVGGGNGIAGTTKRLAGVNLVPLHGSEGVSDSVNVLEVALGPAAAATALPVEAKQKCANATGVGTTNAKTQLGSKRGVSANLTGCNAGTIPFAVVGTGRSSEALPSTGVDVAAGGEVLSLAVPEPQSPRQQRTANREAAGVPSVASAAAATTVAASVMDTFTSSGSKGPRTVPGVKSAGGQSPPWQLHRGVEGMPLQAGVPSPSQARIAARSGVTITSSNQGAVMGPGSTLAAAPGAASIVPPSPANAKPVTLAQVVAGAGKHSGSGSGWNISNSVNARKNSAPRAPGPVAHGVTSDGTGNSVGPSSGGCNAAGTRPSASTAMVSGPGLEPPGASGRIKGDVRGDLRGSAAPNSTAAVLPAATAEEPVSQHTSEQPRAVTVQQQQLTSGTGLQLQSPDMSTSATTGMSAAPHFMQMTQVTAPLSPPAQPTSAQLGTPMRLSAEDFSTSQPHTCSPSQSQLQLQSHPHPYSHPAPQLQLQSGSSSSFGTFQGFARPAPHPPTTPGYSPIAESLRLLEPGTDHPGYTQPPLGAPSQPCLSQAPGLGLGGSGIGGGTIYTHPAVSNVPFAQGIGATHLGVSDGTAAAAAAGGLPAMALGAIRAGHVANHPYRQAGTATAPGSGAAGGGVTPNSATAATAMGARQLLPSRPAASQPVSPIRMYGTGHDHSAGGGPGAAGYGVRHGMPMLPQGLPHNDWTFGGAAAAGSVNSCATAEAFPPSHSGSLLHPQQPSQAVHAIFGSSPIGHLLPAAPGYAAGAASSPTPPPGAAPSSRPPPPQPPPQPQPQHHLHSGIGLRSTSGPVMPPGGLAVFGACGATWTAVRAINARDAGGASGAGGGALSTSAPAHQHSPTAGAGASDASSIAVGSASTAGVTIEDLAWSRYPMPWNSAVATATDGAASSIFPSLDPACGASASTPVSNGSLCIDPNGGFFRTGSSISLHCVGSACTGGDAMPPGSSPSRSGSALSLRPSVGLAGSASASVQSATAGSLLAGSGSIWSIKPSEAAGGLGNSSLVPSAFSTLSTLSNRLHPTRETSHLNSNSSAVHAASAAGSVGGGAASSANSSLDHLKASSRGSSTGDSSGAGGTASASTPASAAAAGGGGDVGVAAVSGSSAAMSTTSASSYSFHCPLTRKLMRDPVVAADGFTYEREAIMAWLLTHAISPLTGERLCSRDVVPNWTMRAAIQLLARQ